MNKFEKQYTVLRKLLENGIALDIDETLADTNAYWAELIFRRHGHAGLGNAHDAIRAYKYVRNVPEWQTDEIRQKVSEFIHSDDVVLSTPPVRGSQEGVASLRKIKTVSCYISGRPRSVERATYKWLHDHGFPESHVIFQPSVGDMTDMGFENAETWRMELLKFLYPNVGGLIDDNEHIVTHADGYKGRIYLLGSSIKAPNVTGCHDWEDVVRNISFYFHSSAGD